MRSEQQKLIDILFQCVLMRHDQKFRAHFDAMSQEEMAAWVTSQLNGSGFQTTPSGMSWAVLVR